MFRIAHILDIGSILRKVTKCRVKSERKPTVEELEGRLMTFFSHKLCWSSQSMKGLFVMLIESAMSLIGCIFWTHFQELKYYWLTRLAFCRPFHIPETSNASATTLDRSSKDRLVQELWICFFSLFCFERIICIAEWGTILAWWLYNCTTALKSTWFIY